MSAQAVELLLRVAHVMEELKGVADGEVAAGDRPHGLVAAVVLHLAFPKQVGL